MGICGPVQLGPNVYLQDASVTSVCLQRLLASETTRLFGAFGGMSKGDGQQDAWRGLWPMWFGFGLQV